jgi:IS5 family transposase
MRQDRTVQASIFDLFAKHEIGCELKKASAWLDEHPALIGLAAADLRRDGVQETGRHGLPAEAVLRCALLKQYRQLSYEELAFHLEDSASFRAFARLPWGWSPKKSVLHKTIGAIRAETWEAVNRTLLASAREGKIEDGSVVRLDSTALILSLSKDGGAAASAQRQQPALGRRPCDGSPVEAGPGLAG